MNYTDAQLEELAGRYAELEEDLPRVTFDQFCRLPAYYERQVQFGRLEPCHHCEGCPHYDTWVEYHPYGDGKAAQNMCECTGHADDCPRVSWEEV